MRLLNRGRARQGIHQRQQASRTAIEYFTKALKSSPADSHVHLSVRWLLNIAYMTIGEYPDGVPAAYLIPASTFASCVRRSARDSSKRSAFVEVEVAEAPQAARVDERGERFEILMEAPHGDRRLLVPPRFDPADLQRLVRVLEETC